MVRLVRQPLQRLLGKLERAEGGPAKTDGFLGTVDYWEQRYRDHGTSGMGSYGVFARVKARFINEYIRANGIRSVIDFGAGDGNQLRLLQIPQYIGLDTSQTAIERLRQQFAGDQTKQFVLQNGEAAFDDPRWRAELGLSLDVIYHVVEDEIYERYMRDLFRCARSHVIIYSSNREPRWRFSEHVRDRRFSEFVDRHFPEWRLEQTSRNPLGPLSRSDFYVYRRRK